MKKTIKRILVCVAVVVMVFAFCTTAFAGTTSSKTFSATTCYNRFTTSNSITKPSGTTWDWMTIMPNEITFAPASEGYANIFLATPKCGSVVIDDEVVVQEGYGENCYCYNNTANPGRWIVKNQYGPGGPNMITNGYFWGTYK